MKSCFLFGHRDCPDTILPRIEEAIQDLYFHHGITVFYVGNRGRFDSLAAAAVKRMKLQYSDICLYLLLAYHPGQRTVELTEGFDGSYYPPLERTPMQYAIAKANRYMADHSQALICYVCHAGNTRNLLAYAQRKSRACFPILNVADAF